MVLITVWLISQQNCNDGDLISILWNNNRGYCEDCRYLLLGSSDVTFTNIIMTLKLLSNHLSIPYFNQWIQWYSSFWLHTLKNYVCLSFFRTYIVRGLVAICLLTGFYEQCTGETLESGLLFLHYGFGMSMWNKLLFETLSSIFFP